MKNKFRHGDRVFCETFKKYGIFQCYNPEDSRFCVVRYTNFSQTEKEADILTMVKSLQLINADSEQMKLF